MSDTSGLDQEGEPAEVTPSDPPEVTPPGMDTPQTCSEGEEDGEEDEGDVSEEEDEYLKQEELDPRVQVELETLNTASEEINTLETELDKARNKFRSMLADSTQRLNQTFKKLGKVVLKVRPYYELLKQSKQAQAEAQKAAVHFQRANSVYQAAKEMVQLAEERNYPEDGDRRAFDAAWQEMLNHATIKFMESEKEKADSEVEHLKRADEYGSIQQKLRFYEKDQPRNIAKAKPYFDLKDKLEHSLQLERIQVEDLQMGLVCAKHKYRQTLNNLEAISEEIHQKRKKRLELPPRTPGVGAESVSDLTSLPSINLDNLSDTTSFASLDLDADGASLKEEVPDYEKPSSSPQNLSDKLAIKTEEKAMNQGQRTNKSVNVTDNLEKVSIGRRVAEAEGSECVENPSVLESPDKPPIMAFTPTYHDITKPAPSLSPKTPTNKSSSRKQQKIQTQMAFPILQGLSQTYQRLSPGIRGQRPPIHGGYVQAYRAPNQGGYVQPRGSFHQARPVNPQAHPSFQHRSPGGQFHSPGGQVHSPGGQFHSPGGQQKYSPGSRSYSPAGMAVAQEESDGPAQTQGRKKKVEVFV